MPTGAHQVANQRSEANNELAVRQFAWIPRAMLDCLKVNSTAEHRYRFSTATQAH